MDLLAAVRRTIHAHRLAAADTRLVVALSGGPDSVALAWLLRELADAGELTIAGAAHLNHQLRDTADRDEAFCRQTAGSLGWPIVAGREDVAALARRQQCSLESAAHLARVAFLERARIELGGDRVALGHSRDDQAETVLLRLLRGAGPRGLSGMHPRNGRLIRPLLGCRRAGLRAYLDARGLSAMDDESNRDRAIPRNRVRLDLIPALAAMNPSVVDALADAADVSREQWAWLSSASDELLALARRITAAGQPALDVAVLREAAPAVRRTAVWRAMEETSGRTPSFRHVEAVLRLLDQPGNAASDAPGVRVQRDGGRLVLTGRPAGSVGRIPEARANLFRYSLSIPGEAAVMEAACLVSARLAPGGTAEVSPTVAVLRGTVPGPLVVRSRLPGDRFHPAGGCGRKKLQDYFVDHRIARGDRDRVPIVTDATGRILWVGGLAVDEEFRAPEGAESVLILRLLPFGGAV